MLTQTITRRQLLRLSGAISAGTLLAACQPKVVEKIVRETVEVEKVVKETVVVKEAVEVEKEVTRVIEKEVQAAAPEPVELTYWHPWSGTFGDLVDRLARDFEKDFDWITINVSRVEWAQFLAKILSAVAAGAPPDGFMIFNGSGMIYTLADKGALIPFEEVANPADLEEYQRLIHPNIYQLGEYQGKVYGVPQWAQMYMLYYNTDLLEEAGIDPEKPPKSYEELDAYADKLYKVDERGNVGRIGYRPAWPRAHFPQFGASLLNDAGEITANNPRNVAVLEWAMGYAKKYDWTRINEFRTAAAAAGDVFIFGNEAILRSGPWYIGSIKDAKPDLRYGTWHMPEVEGYPGTGVMTYGDIPLIPKGSPHPEETFQWVRYLTGVGNPEAYADLFVVGRRPHMPSSQIVAQSPAFEKVRNMFPGFDKFLDKYYDAPRYTFPPKTPIADFYIGRWEAWRDKAMLGEITAQQAVDGCQEEVEKELARYLQSRS